MYVCMYVYAYVYICAYVYVSIHVYVYMCMCICVCVFVCMCVYVCVCMCACVRVCKKNSSYIKYIYIYFLVGWFFGVLLHINICSLFNAKFIFIQIISSISDNSV